CSRWARDYGMDYW
nr:immunoglobulin heavy chain junction region [Mus musculus]MBK4197714.1 immunoglobulin heavy chain junction region [Mus musculus]MBK4197715.1 immunoglobulin heavy chain junction region [Mus musculus]